VLEFLRIEAPRATATRRTKLRKRTASVESVRTPPPRADPCARSSGDHVHDVPRAEVPRAEVRRAATWSSPSCPQRSDASRSIAFISERRDDAQLRFERSLTRDGRCAKKKSPPECSDTPGRR